LSTDAPEPLVPGGPSYEAMARLLTAVWPEMPASARFFERMDRDRAPDAPRRAVIRDPADRERLLALVEWGKHPGRRDGAHFLMSLAVLPGHRRRGLGQRLLRLALDDLPRDAARLETSTSEDRPEAVAFLERRGFTVQLRTQLSELDLETFDPAPISIRDLEKEGLTVRSLAGDASRDEALLRSIHALQAETARDAPGGDRYELEPFDRWRAMYRDNPDFLPEGHLVALDGTRVVGMTQLWASNGTPAIVYTGFTGVARSHRRRGIATVLKVRSLGWARRLRDPEGRYPVVRTGNAETNPMLQLNLRLGFRPLPARLRMERRLGAG